MRTWNLKVDDPISLTLAADARLVTTDYINDHIWELTLIGGDPPAIAIQTTFGLRARSFRLFPRFIERGVTLSDPTSFSRPPVVNQFFPNYARLLYSPIIDIDVIAEYWVPESHALAGQLKITNSGNLFHNIRLECAAMLNPSKEGQLFSPLEIGSKMVLTGSTGNLKPILYLSEGAEAVTSPYPALAFNLDLPEGSTRTINWVEASMADINASFELALQIAARKWEAEFIRIELINSGQIEIHTGDSEWDAAFTLAQNSALGLFCGPTSHLPAASYVLSRQPDFGYSSRGDGSDYNHLWNGQSILETYYLFGMILPSAPQLAQGLVNNYLAVQNLEGGIDWKPGLGGQRSQLMAIPLLAYLTWSIFKVTQDRSFISNAFSILLNFFLSWFKPQHDGDGDGIPEWEHVIQTGFEDNPMFSHWSNWARGIDITMAECPSLCSFLYRECQCLIQMANFLGLVEPMLALQTHLGKLKAAVEASWDDITAIYRYWDRDSHFSNTWETLGERYGVGEITVRRGFEHPTRMLVRVHTLAEPSRQILVFIHGTSTSGQHLIEKIPYERLRWYLNLGSATSERVYTTIEHVEIQGADKEDRFILQTVGYDCPDHTALLPLWAGIPDPDRARTLVKRTITDENGFWQLYGIRACANLPMYADDSNTCQSIHLPWNTFIGEGLVDYGFRSEAAELVTRIMRAVVFNLKRDKTFRRFYNSQTGAGIGEQNALIGLAPVGLFLYTLGVKVYSPTRVEISGFNPFPWPVTVKYQGLSVLRHNGKTTIIFPNGQAISLDGAEPRIITLDE